MAVRVRPIRFEGDVAFVPLTKGYEAVIDAADAWLVERFNWFAVENASGNVYAGRGVRAGGTKYSIFLHRQLLIPPRHLDVDHKDGDGLNCRRKNLRICTRLQNNQNCPTRRTNKLGVKGVFQSGARFLATIKIDGRSCHLGTFDTVEEAKAAYDTAAQATFGEFARAA